MHLVLYLKSHRKTQSRLDFSPMVSSRSSIVLHFTFGSELIFVNGVSSVSRLLLWHVNVQLFQHNLFYCDKNSLT